MQRRLATALVVVAVGTVLLLAFAPVMTTSSCEITDGAASVCSTGSESLVEHEGLSVLLVLAVPLVLTAVAVARPSRRARVTVAVGFTILALVGAASIGLFLLPLVAVAWLLAYATGPETSGV